MSLPLRLLLGIDICANQEPTLEVAFQFFLSNVGPNLEFAPQLMQPRLLHSLRSAGAQKHTLLRQLLTP